MRGRIFHTFFFLFLIFTFAGCGVEEKRVAPGLGSGDLRWASFPVLIRVEENLFDRGEAEDDLLAAIAFWEEKAGRRLFTLGSWPNGQVAYEGNPDNPSQIYDNTLVFPKPWPFESWIAGKTVVVSRDSSIQKGIIFLNAQNKLCSGTCWGQEGLTSRRKLIAHELGHFIGFAHVDNDRKNVMFPEIQPGGSLDGLSVDTALLQKLTR